MCSTARRPVPEPVRRRIGNTLRRSRRDTGASQCDASPQPGWSCRISPGRSCLARSGTAPEALAAVRNTVLRLVRSLPGPLTAIRETFAENRLDAITLAKNGLL